MSGYMATILVADDDPDIAELVELHLAGEGFRVFKAYDGAEALNIFGREKIDLAILDIMMPGVDGIQVCKRIREFSTIPVIMLSARDSEEDKVAGLEIGADDYVTKPFQKGELAARVQCVHTINYFGLYSEFTKIVINILKSVNLGYFCFR